MTTVQADKPLDGMLVIDFSQFLSGPSASLRLADLGARVIKIERSGIGDICRKLYISNQEVDGDSTLFHAINRNKESYEVDLKKPEDLASVTQLIAQADILIENFRPGVMNRMGLSYEQVSTINPRIIYGEITGYGDQGPWSTKPGQDLLIQSMSGLTWLNGEAEQSPVPFGLAIADMVAGAQLVQGILACLVRRSIQGKGAYVQVSLLEAIVDVQIEALSVYLNAGQKLSHNNVYDAHSHLPAHSGIYRTQDGYIAIGSGIESEMDHERERETESERESFMQLCRWVGCEERMHSALSREGANRRSQIKQIIASHLSENTTAYWLKKLDAAHYPASDVCTWNELVAHEAFQVLQMTQKVQRKKGTQLITTRCPIRIDGNLYTSPIASPQLGEDTEKIIDEFKL